MNESAKMSRLFERLINCLPKDNLSHDSFFVAVGLFANKAPAFLLSIYLANKLGPTYFGIYALLKVALVTLGNFTVSGQHLILNKVYSQESESRDISYLVSLSSVIGFVSCLIVVAAVGFSEEVNQLFRIPKGTEYSKFLLIGIPIIGWELVCHACMVATRRVKALAAVNGLSGLVLVGATFLLVPTWGFQGALWAYIASVFIGVVVSYSLLLRDAKWSVDWMRYIRHPEFKRNGGALGMQEVVFLITNLAFAVVLSRGLGHENYAVYSVIVQWVGLSHLGSVVVRNPAISEASRNQSKVRFVLRRSIIFVSAFSVVFAVGVSGVISIVELYPGLVGMHGWLLPLGVLLGLPKQVFGVVWPFGVVLNRSWAVLIIRTCRDIFLAGSISWWVLDLQGVLWLEFAIHTIAAGLLVCMIQRADG